MTNSASEPESYPDRPHLKASRQLMWDRVPATTAAAAAIADLLGELEATQGRKRALRATDRARLESTLGAIVLDLFLAAGEDPEMWLAYSRRNEDYEADKRRYVHPMCQFAPNVGPPFAPNISPLTPAFAVARRRSAKPLA